MVQKFLEMMSLKFLIQQENYKKNKKNQNHIYLIDTFRHLEHCGPNNDDHLAYRSKIYVSKWLNNDPLNKVRKDLVNLKYLKKMI